VADLVAAAARGTEGAAALDSTLEPLAGLLSSIRYDLEEATRALQTYLDRLEADPARLDAVQSRLAVLADLKRKYGATIEEVLAFADDAEARLTAAESGEARADALKAEIEAARTDQGEVFGALTTARVALARRFEEAVTGGLGELAMERATFRVEVGDAPPGPTGADAVEFLLTTNPGEPLRPLARIASGGEISRVMLAIKSATASRAPLPTLVFDEVDVGIGGRTASVVGEKLRGLAQAAQVLCITHLPQIAVFATTQYAITKVDEAGRSVVRISSLSEGDRIEELGRMLAGAEVTDAARAHVRQMLTRIHG
jgi:DNA repair protein RecN (Recombination protein N)